MKKKVTLLGSTGSIGRQTLESCKRLGCEVVAISANQSVELLEKQARAFQPEYVALADASFYKDLKTRLADMPVKVLAGMEGLCQLAALDQVDVVCNAVMGMVGLLPTMSALKAGKTLALANKETLVVAGHLVMETAAQSKAAILPVDSEHSAIFQCLQGNDRKNLRKIILTASGGPFRGKTKEQLRQVSLEEALHHPNWNMGAKITVDSATLMNKGLEFIEAMWLFGVSWEQIEIVVHPQSVVHSAVEYEDGSVIAQMGTPDMAIPIQYALTYPQRMETNVKPLSLSDYGQLTFEKPDLETFSCLSCAIEAAKKRGLYPCAVNAANEQAVTLFLQGKIPFYKIPECVQLVLAEADCKANERYTLEDVFQMEQTARNMVLEYCRV